MSIEAAIESGRRVIATTLLDTCTIERPTAVPDLSGGTTETLVEVAAGVPCRFGVVLDPDPEIVAGSIYGAPTASLLIGLEVDVALGDRVTNETSGRVWLVIGDRTPDSTLALIGRVLLRDL